MPSVIRASGEPCELVAKPRISSEELLRTRDREFYIHILQGWPLSKIGEKYRVSKPLISYRVNHVLPESEKARIRRMGYVESVA